MTDDFSRFCWSARQLLCWFCLGPLNGQWSGRSKMVFLLEEHESARWCWLLSGAPHFSSVWPPILQSVNWLPYTGVLRGASQGAKVKATKHPDACTPELTQPHFRHVLLVKATPQNQLGFKESQNRLFLLMGVAAKSVFQSTTR